jgi:hypothetical protein
MDLVGMTKARQTLTKQVQGARFATRAELMEFLFDLAGRIARLAPVETGDLRSSVVVVVNGERWLHSESDSSGGVRIVRDRQDVPMDISTITIYVGTSGCIYALRQHEELTWRHPRGGQAKFVEVAWGELMGALKARLQDAARNGAKGEYGSQ